MVAYTAITVHHRFWKEHKIDEMVFKVMKRGQIIGIAGTVFCASCLAPLFAIFGIGFGGGGVAVDKYRLRNI